MFRSFLAIQRARLTVLLKYSEKIEPQWKLYSKKQAGKDYNKSMEVVDDKKKGDKSKK